MRLDKAIEIVSDSANRGITTFNQDYKDAQKLLIEAGKSILAYRRWGRNNLPQPLQGETNE